MFFIAYSVFLVFGPRAAHAYVFRSSSPHDGARQICGNSLGAIEIWRKGLLFMAASKIWDRLQNIPHVPLNILFDDAHRVENMTRILSWGEGDDARSIRFDFAKTHLHADLLTHFEELAVACDFAQQREALLGGAMINNTEGRAAEHTAQRGVGAEASVQEAQALHRRTQALVEAVHAGVFGDIKHLLHIGIGGSALGPAMAIDALTRDGARLDVHVISNIDGLALEGAFAKCDPQTTLIAIASKTFTTIETMTNAQSALQWLRSGGVEDPVGRCVALTANPQAALDWGVDESRILPFPETVGGRYSLWSSIGFPIALAIGWDGFAHMLAGALAMDEHFRDCDGRDNLALLAAFVDQYYTRLRSCQTRAVFAYDERLRFLPDYLQQLEMESNGKSVTRSGEAIEYPSAPITWGGVGTDGQHAVFQLLHQGTHLIPVDFIASIAPGDVLDEAHHRILLTNCLAQGAALMSGGNMAPDGTDPARGFPGDRPSTTILCDDIDPATLGALIAYHEHRTFCNAVLLQINPFDQFGVELGKKMAKDIEGGKAEFDPSTTALLRAAGIN